MKIIEWNIGLTKKYGDIIGKICKDSADIFILTEVKKDFDYNNEELKKRYNIYGNRGNKEQNRVLILINKDNNEHTNIISQSEEKNPEPDYLILGLGELVIMGIRFRNYRTSDETNGWLDEQQKCFWKLLDEHKPNIVVGDFNVSSALTYKGSSWSRFRKLIRDKKYCYYDASIENYTFSFQRCIRKRELNIGTCTDHFFCKEDIGHAVKSIQYYWGDDDNERKQWLSDHAMLIIELKEKDCE